jgi:glycosyltransferase 2 family protein
MTESELEDVAPPPAPASKRGGGLKVLIRIAVGAGVLAFLLVKADVGQLWDQIQNAKVVYLLAALAAIFGGLILSAFRWKAYLDALEIPLRIGTLFRLYFVGTFFNAFLPTGIGGDAYKAVRLGRDKESLAPAFASVFLDRFAGVVGMAAIGLVSSAYLIASGDPRRRVPGIALLLSLAIMGAAVILLVGGERLLGRGRLVKHEGIGGRIRRAMRSIHAAARHPEAAARGYLFGVLFQALVLGYHISIAKALGIEGVPMMAFASIVVISSLATMIPLSINGLGFREGAYIWALGQYLIPLRGKDSSHDVALAFALLVLASLLLASLVGGLIYVILGGEVHKPGPRGARGRIGAHRDIGDPP